MKRFIKLRSRKGFTLVETILATFILFVVSSMLVNGFIAAIGYSYQTSIYNKSGSDNYGVCMTDIGKWSKKSVQDREIAAVDDYTDDEKKTLQFVSRGVHSETLEGVNVIYYEHDDLSGTVPDDLAFTDGRFAPTSHVDQHADNRKAFCYYPEHCVDKDGNNKGNIIVMLGSDSKYYWVVNDGNFNKDSVTSTPIHSS